MLPTNSNFLDSPTKKIKDLVESAKITYDPSFTLKQYVRSAQAILNQADQARVKGDMEGAFVNSLKATTIIFELVHRDKDYEKHKTDPDYLAAKKRVIGMLDDTEKIKELLLAKYESVHEIDTQAIEAASKAGKPKPPPRPHKPVFLSSKFDGTTPSTTVPTSFGSSSSSSTPAAPAAPYVAQSSPSMDQTGLLGSFASMSISTSTPPLSQASYPPPTSLPGYRPLQPTAYNATSSIGQPIVTTNVSATAAIFPNGSSHTALLSSSLPPPLPMPSNSMSGMSGSQSSYSTPVPSPIPVPAPRPAHTLAPPISSPASLPNGDSKLNTIKANTSAPSSGESPSPAPSAVSSAPATEASRVTQPLKISPQKVLSYMRQDKPPKLLLIDVRMQVQYRSARIKSQSIVNIEPLALRDGISSKVIADQSLFDNPQMEQNAFQDRHKFDLVLYYDQNTAEIPKSGPLANLFRALHELEFEKPLARLPVLLIGGFDAWLDCAGMNWVEGVDVDAARRVGHGVSAPIPIVTPRSDSSNSAPDPDVPLSRPGSTPIPQDHQPQNHAIFTKLSRGGGINRHDGRIIRRNIGEYIVRDDEPQSMVNPRIPSTSPSNYPNTFNPAYPPTATPQSNINSTPPPSHMASFNNSNINHNNAPYYSNQGGYPHGAGSGKAEYQYQGQPGYPGGPNYGPSAALDTYKIDSNASTLNRRQTIYDNHWNNFGAHDKPYSPTSANASSPPIPDKIPIPGVGMGVMMNTNNISGTSMPPTPIPNSLAMRPAIPTKPMRPLPQPPGMSDLRSYTQFGSGFSKIGSQLGKTGLTNLGNTCFMNSVIQCLIATPPLSRFFLDGSFKRHINMRNVLGTQGRLAEAFSDLIRSMWSGQSLVVSPTSFRYAIAGFAPQFKGTEQHDSQEFLSFLLDGLHEDLKREPRPPPPGDNEGSEADEARMEKLPEYEASEIAWQRYLRRDDSIVVSLFQGQFKNRLCCSKCGKTSTTYNAFMYLALPIKAKVPGRQPQTLASCLNNFVEPETMEGDNAWNCPNCKKPRKATKHLTISRVPDVLLIQLKRFSSDGPFKNKIKAMVQYPIHDLDLTKYLPKRAGSAPPEPAIYDLYAVSNHSGEVSSGHYTACVRGEAPGSWTNFDDTRVSPCDKSVAVSEHGYTLFYVRKK
ncbi:ubiquitin-specific protease doa4 [Podila clonocystis]|nr:ubiquitin-specific protease doa4 [Podila clonocystis]